MGTCRTSGGNAAAGGGGTAKAPTRSAIERAKFTNEGFGNWQIDMQGVGGGQILDESDGRQNAYGQFGGKLYSVKTWDANYKQSDTRYAGSLNEAKRMVKDEMLRGR